MNYQFREILTDTLAGPKRAEETCSPSLKITRVTGTGRQAIAADRQLMMTLCWHDSRTAGVHNMNHHIQPHSFTHWLDSFIVIPGRSGKNILISINDVLGALTCIKSRNHGPASPVTMDRPRHCIGILSTASVCRQLDNLSVAVCFFSLRVPCSHCSTYSGNYRNCRDIQFLPIYLSNFFKTFIAAVGPSSMSGRPDLGVHRLQANNNSNNYVVQCISIVPLLVTIHINIILLWSYVQQYFLLSTDTEWIS